MNELKAFLSSPSRNHLIIHRGCIEGLMYLDVGYEISAFIEDRISDRRLSMRIQEHFHSLLHSHVCKSEEYGDYLALKNIGILFEPLLKFDIEILFDKWSQDTMLILDIGKGIIADKKLFLTPGCSSNYSVSLERLNYLEV